MMKRLICSICILTLMSISANATSDTLADSDTTEGIIRKVDRNTLTIVLSDGKTYVLPGEIDAEAISEGMEVVLAYEDEGGLNRITDMVIYND